MQALASSRCALRVQPVAPASVSRGSMVVVAAVPKKKMSKMKTDIRKAAWKAKVLPAAEKALFLAKLALQKDGSRESRDKDMSIAAPGGGEAAPAEAPPAESSQ